MKQIQLFDIDMYSDSDNANIYIIGLEPANSSFFNINLYVGDPTTNSEGNILKVKQTVFTSENKGDITFAKSYLKAFDRKGINHLFMCLYISDTKTTLMYRIINSGNSWKFEVISTPINGYVMCMDIDSITGDVYIGGSFGIGRLDASQNYTYSNVYNNEIGHEGILTIVCTAIQEAGSDVTYIIAGLQFDDGRLCVSRDRGASWTKTSLSDPNPVRGGVGKIVLHKYSAKDENDKDTPYLGCLLFQEQGISRVAINLAVSDIEFRWYTPVKTLDNYDYTPVTAPDTLSVLFKGTGDQMDGDTILISNVDGVATNYQFNIGTDNPGEYMGLAPFGINSKFIYNPGATVKQEVKLGYVSGMEPYIYALTGTGILTIWIDGSAHQSWEDVVFQIGK